MIVSPEALKRMIHHDPHSIDHLLLEWTIAVECKYAGERNPPSTGKGAGGKLKAIFPVMFGSRNPGPVNSIKKAVTTIVGDILSQL